MKLIPEKYKKSAFIAHLAAELLAERLKLFDLKPQRIAISPSRDGYLSQLIQHHYPHAQVIKIDPQLEFLQYKKNDNSLCGEGMNALQTHSVDQVFSNLEFNFPFKKTMGEWKRVIRHQGMVFFSIFAAGTLKQLQGIDLQQYDIQEVGDALTEAGFQDAVLDVEHFTVTYRESNTLFSELEQSGLIKERVGLSLPEKNIDGLFAISFEIIFGHAFAPRSDDFRADETGTVRIPLSYLHKRQIKT